MGLMNRYISRYSSLLTYCLIFLLPFLPNYREYVTECYPRFSNTSLQIQRTVMKSSFQSTPPIY